MQIYATQQSIRRMIAAFAAKKNGIPFSIYHNNKFQENFRTIRRVQMLFSSPFSVGMPFSPSVFCSYTARKFVFFFFSPLLDFYSKKAGRYFKKGLLHRINQSFSQTFPFFNTR